MLIECGFVHATLASDGREFTFRPSLGRIAALGTPAEIVEIYVSLHGPNAAQTAAYVLACLCDQEDPTPMIGWRDWSGWHDGEMSPDMRVFFARQLMQDGICGKARPGHADKAQGAYAANFDAAAHIAAARMHLGLSAEDAEALSMTEVQQMFRLKFPDAEGGDRKVATREEYDAAMARFDEMAARRQAAAQPEAAQ